MTKTVFVIGAGASTEFGGAMPIGAQLAEAIESLMTQENRASLYSGPISQALMRRSGGLSQVEQRAIQRIQQGIVSKESIDDFIDEWNDVPSLAEVAKIGIAHALLEAKQQTFWGQATAKLVTPQQALRNCRESWLGKILRLHNRGTARCQLTPCQTLRLLCLTTTD